VVCGRALSISNPSLVTGTSTSPRSAAGGRVDPLGWQFEEIGERAVFDLVAFAVGLPQPVSIPRQSRGL
jgi:hypothetical protein